MSMRRVVWQDEEGWMRASLIRETDPLSVAPQGLPLGIDVRDLDWEAIQKELNKLLVQRGIDTAEDLRKKGADFRQACEVVLRQRLIDLYFQKE